MAESRPDQIFKPLSADSDSAELATAPTEIESMCVQCEENGVTKLLLTRIPHYRDVILISFNCDSCGYSNNEVQSGSQASEKGIKIKVVIEDERDLSRQVIKGECATISVPEIELEIPAESQKGTISNVEGILSRTIEGLVQDQTVRRHMDPEGAKQIDEYVQKIQDLLQLKQPFHIIVRDPSGNSYVENICAPLIDKKREVSTFVRTKEEDHKLGFYTKKEIEESQGVLKEEEEETDEVTNDEILKFETNCPNCNAPAQTNMKMTEIPHFKEVVIMSTTCDYCGHKTNEVKSGSGIEPKGTRITLNVTDSSDLSRDVLKAETANILIPELDFEMGGFALGGRFTTLEGLIQNMIDQVDNNPMLGGCLSDLGGDSQTLEMKERLQLFKERLTKMKDGEEKFTFVIDDPTGNSYLQNLYAPDDDPEMRIEHYERTYEQNDDLGLNDMKTENYGEHEILAKGEKPKNSKNEAR